MPASLSPQDFVAKWKKINLTERSSAQSHFIDLCHMLGLPTPTDADPTGENYAFERGVNKHNAGQGWADVWKRGFFAWEYKRNWASLEKAYDQLLQYRESLENPPLLIVSDNLTIEIHTNFNNMAKRVERLTLDDLLDPRKLEMLRNVFVKPDAFKTTQTVQEVTEKAATESAKLADLLRKQGIEPSRAAHFLIRLLFCLFAEDVRLLPENIFTRLVQKTYQRPASYFANELRQLFTAMRSGGLYLLENIPYFNGGLFNDDDVIELDNQAMEILLKVCNLDWSNVEPAILGTLFERSLDPSKRAQLGAHYTSRSDILLIVEPVLIAPLRRRWVDLQQQARDLSQRRDVATGGPRTNLNKELTALLTRFHDEIARLRVLDPACGSGNFLYVALKQLLDLQKEIAIFANEVGLPRLLPSVSPEQLYGIEINEYAHELAQATVWIGYIQWWKNNGFGDPAEPILKPLHNILQMDAILAYDDQGRPTEPPWPAADIIIGNPPFLGGNKIRQELGNHYVDNLFSLYEGRVPAFADLICYWFERARELIAADKIKRAGLLATNSIRGGVNRRVLEHIKETGDIFMAWSDRAWILDGAAVRVSMIGFDNGLGNERMLDGLPVATVNADLTGSLDLLKARSLGENSHLQFEGTKKGADFDIPNDLAQIMLKAPVNPNGRPNSDVIHPWVNGFDLTRRPRRMWVIDFGVSIPLDEAALYEVPFAYIEKHVKPKYAQTRKMWWLHERTRPDMRIALAPLSRFIGTARVSKHRIFVWLSKATIPDSATIAIAREDDYFFGVLHSKLHEMWSLRLCTWLGVGNDPRYTPTTTFETFPFPWSPGQESTGDKRVEAIGQAARDLVEKRDNWLNPPGADEAELKKRTLTNLYNQRPTWLDLAHKKLDGAVLAAYGWPTDLSDEQILERLLTLNLQRAVAQGQALPPAPADDEQ